MNTVALIADLAQHLPPEKLAAVSAQLILGEDAINRVAKTRQHDAERQRRKRRGEATVDACPRMSRDIGDEKKSSPTPPYNKNHHQEEKTAFRLRDDWIPSEEDRAFAKESGWTDEKIATGIKSFHDYYRPLVGERAYSLDWSAKWRIHVLFWSPRSIDRRLPPREPKTGMSGSATALHGALKRLAGYA